MSDQNETAEAVTQNADVKWDVTLEGGNTYTFRGVKYEKGVTHKGVDNATKEALEKRAVDSEVVSGRFEEDGTAQTTVIEKFKFVRVGAAPATPAPRKRVTR